MARTIREAEGTSQEKEEAMRKLQSEIESSLRQETDPQLEFYDDKGKPRLNLGIFGKSPQLMLGGQQSEASVDESYLSLSMDDRELPIVVLNGYVATMETPR